MPEYKWDITCYENRHRGIGSYLFGSSCCKDAPPEMVDSFVYMMANEIVINHEPSPITSAFRVFFYVISLKFNLCKDFSPEVLRQT